MLRLANKTIPVPKNVSIHILSHSVEVRGSKKTIHLSIHPNLKLISEDNTIKVGIQLDETDLNKTKQLKLKRRLNVLAGTTWANLKNAITGVSEGFKIKLELVGVGYRAKVQGNKIDLSLGFAHPVIYTLPEEVTAETPSQTEIILSSHDNQILGQAAAKIRAHRPPEPYKGKGIKYAGEKLVLKETKKK